MLALLAVVATTLGVTAATANASTLASQLRTSQTHLAQAKREYARSLTVLTTALKSERRGLVSVGQEMEKARHALRFWQTVVAGLLARQDRQQEAARADSPAAWRTLITQAARQNGVSADGMYRLMMMESGGRARVVGAGTFYGLYQYSLRTWRGSWNPWRGASVFDGAAQIKATAVAVRRGMGRSLWASTYSAAF